ncbi:hypothetical protein HOC13_01320 [Candidatus Woesearchaeota archaeon]|jgi:hypothetical protein|nr:hypothetical protein [Candidatus Woesearchaeota archaeon]
MSDNIIELRSREDLERIVKTSLSDFFSNQLRTFLNENPNSVDDIKREISLFNITDDLEKRYEKKLEHFCGFIRMFYFGMSRDKVDKEDMLFHGFLDQFQGEEYFEMAYSFRNSRDNSIDNLNALQEFINGELISHKLDLNSIREPSFLLPFIMGLYPNADSLNHTFLNYLEKQVESVGQLTRNLMLVFGKLQGIDQNEVYRDVAMRKKKFIELSFYEHSFVPMVECLYESYQR